MPIYPGAGRTWSNQFYKIRQIPYPVYQPFSQTNNFDGIATGATISTANSGGVSGKAFDSVSIGANASAISDGTYVAHGINSARLQTTTSAVTCFIRWSSFVPQPVLWFRTNFLIQSLPGANQRVLHLANSGTLCAAIQVLTTGALRWIDTAGGTVSTTTNLLAPGQFVRIEGFVYGNSTGGKVELQLFQNIESNIPTEILSNSANTFDVINQMTYGTTPAITNYGPFWYDDIGISNTGYMGPAAFPEFVPQLESFPGQQWQKKYQHRQVTYLTTPDSLTGAPQANVNVFGQADNSVVVTPSPPAANVNVASRWSVLQSAGNTAHAASSITATLSTALTNGSKLIAFVSHDAGSTATITSVQDSNGNNFTEITANNFNTNLGAGTFWVLDTPLADVGTTQTITASFQNTVDTSIVVQEVAGLAPGTTGSIDGTAAVLTGSATGSLQGPPTYSSTASNEYFIYVLLDNGGTTGFAGPSGYTSDPNNVLSGNASVEVFYKNSTGTTETGQFIPGANSLGWVMVMAAFKLSAGIANVIIPGPAANVNASAVTGSINIYQNFNQPVVPVSPVPLRFIPAYLGLRPQYSTALPDVFVPGSAVNVNVSGQADNNVNQILAGTTSNVNVVAPAGSLSITTSTPPQFPFPQLLHNSIKFNPAYANLRVQINTGTPVNAGGIALTGSVANVSVAAPAGSITIVVSEANADNAVAAQAGTVTELVVGAVTNVSVAAISGNISISISGSTGLVNSAAVPGTSGSGDLIVIGVTATAFVTAYPGGSMLTNRFNPDWWRVYRGYGQSPVW